MVLAQKKEPLPTGRGAGPSRWGCLGRRETVVPSRLAVDLSSERRVALVAEVVCKFRRTARRARDDVCSTRATKGWRPVSSSATLSRQDRGFQKEKSQEREKGDSLCFSFRPLFELRMRLAPCVVLRFGAARSHGGRRSRKLARVSGMRDASDGTAAVAAAAVYSGARTDGDDNDEEAADEVARTTKASSASWTGRRAVRRAGSAIEAILIWSLCCCCCCCCFGSCQAQNDGAQTRAITRLRQLTVGGELCL